MGSNLRSNPYSELIYVPAIAEHAQWIFCEMTPDICQWLDRRPLKNIIDTLEYIYNKKAGHSHRYIVFHPVIGPIGMASWGNQIQDSAYISYWVAKACRNRGFAKSIIMGLVSIMNEKNIKDIYASVKPNNLPSIKVLLSFGFKYQFKLKNDMLGYVFP